VPSPFIDVALARRLEAAEAASNRSFVEARADLDPASGACWIEVAGASVLFDTAASPLTQTFGLGLSEPADAAHLAAIERFYAERDAPVYHEVSPLADQSILGLFARRGYHPIELTSVMFRSIEPGLRLSGQAPSAAARRIGPEERDVWSALSAEGWSEYPELASFVEDLARVTAHRADADLFLAEIDGRPIAAGALSICNGVGLLAGASTIPAARRQGAQWALLGKRLEHAAAHGCDLAMMCALPGSASQRNGERHGFQIAYTRIKWRQILSETAPFSL
jgi:GNAT superfamily N-acetyltransferase